MRREKEEQGASNQSASLVQVGAADQDAAFGRFGLFASVDFENRDRKVTAVEAGYESQNWTITVGGDYRLSEAFVVGVGLTGGRDKGNFGGLGRFESDSYGAVAYGSYSLESGFFADVSVAYSRKRFEVERLITGVFNGVGILNDSTGSETQGNEVSARALLGKDFEIGRFSVGPRAELMYAFTQIEGFSESGTSGLQLVYDDRSLTSLQSLVGVQGTAAISTSFAVLAPQLSFEWVHEFKNDEQSIDVRFAEDLRPNPTKFSFRTEKPDRDFFNLRLGLVAVLADGIQPFVEFRTILGHSYFTTYGGALGIRIEL